MPYTDKEQAKIYRKKWYERTKGKDIIHFEADNKTLCNKRLDWNRLLGEEKNVTCLTCIRMLGVDSENKITDR